MVPGRGTSIPRIQCPAVVGIRAVARAFQSPARCGPVDRLACSRYGPRIDDDGGVAVDMEFSAAVLPVSVGEKFNSC